MIGTAKNPQSEANSEYARPVPLDVQERTRVEPFKTLYSLLARIMKIHDQNFLYETITINVNFQCAWHVRV